MNVTTQRIHVSTNHGGSESDGVSLNNKSENQSNQRENENKTLLNVILVRAISLAYRIGRGIVKEQIRPAIRAHAKACMIPETPKQRRCRGRMRNLMMVPTVQYDQIELLMVLREEVQDETLDSSMPISFPSRITHRQRLEIQKGIIMRKN